MPIPQTKDVGHMMSFLKREKPVMPHKQKIAIALGTARKAGASAPNNRESFRQEIQARARKRKLTKGR